MRTHVILLAATTVLAARGVDAQPAPWAPERLTAGWVFTPSAVFGMLHDSNVTVRAVNEPIQAEAIGLINPRGELDFNGRRTHFNLGYSGALEAYHELSALNRYEQRGRMDLRYQALRHLQVSSRAEYAHVPTTDRLDLGPGVLPFISIGSQHAELGGGFHLQTSPRLHITGDVTLQSIRFDRDQTSDPDGFTRYLGNGHSVSPNVNAMYSVAEHVSVGATWNYRHAVVSEGLNVVDVQSVTGDVSWQAAKYTTLTGGLGASHLRSDQRNAGTEPTLVGLTGGLLTRWGPAYHLGVDHQAGAVSMSASYAGSFVPSIGFGGLNANQRLSGSARVPFGQGRYTIGGNVAYGRIEPVDLLGVDFSLHSLWTQVTFGYQISRWFRTEAFVNRTHQTSSARGLVDRTRIGIEFVTAKPVRIQ